MPVLRVYAQKWDAAEGLLYACRKLLSQPYVSPVYAMLLYQWLLVHKDAGGAEQRQKHVNLLVAGARCSEAALGRPFRHPPQGVHARLRWAVTATNLVARHRAHAAAMMHWQEAALST